MDYTRGLAVRSKAGRDKGRFFAVLAVEGDNVLVADGDLRKLEKPKKKKQKHVAATNTVFSEEQLSGNRRLYTAIKDRFNAADGRKEE